MLPVALMRYYVTYCSVFNNLAPAKILYNFYKARSTEIRIESEEKHPVSVVRDLLHHNNCFFSKDA